MSMKRTNWVSWFVNKRDGIDIDEGIDDSVDRVKQFAQT